MRTKETHNDVIMRSMDEENKVFEVVVFEGPDMLAEFGGVSVFGVAE